MKFTEYFLHYILLKSKNIQLESTSCICLSENSTARNMNTNGEKQQN